MITQHLNHLVHEFGIVALQPPSREGIILLVSFLVFGVLLFFVDNNNGKLLI